MVEKYAYLVGNDHQWRYDVAGDSWLLLPSNRPVPAGAPFSGATNQWGIVGAYVYAVLEDGKLYRAQWSATDLAWFGVTCGGSSVPLNASAFQITSVADQAWILGVDKKIAVYDPDSDAIVSILPVPSLLASMTHVGLAWDGGSIVYVALGSTLTGLTDFWSYNLDTGLWASLGLPSGGLVGTLLPMSTLWWDQQLFVMNLDGYLLHYTPGSATWAAYDTAATGLPFGAWLAPLGDTELGMVYSRGASNSMKQVSSAGVFAGRAAPLAIPGGTAVGFFSVYALPAVAPFPATTWPVEVSLPKEFQLVEVPGTRGAVAVESVRGTPTIRLAGKLQAEDGGAMRTLIETALTAFLSPLLLEVLPGRFCTAYVFDHTLDPKWVGVNDTLLDFSFTVKVPDALFYDYAGNGYSLP